MFMKTIIAFLAFLVAVMLSGCESSPTDKDANSPANLPPGNSTPAGTNANSFSQPGSTSIIH
jgi:predicted component of type VI protein secretion system